MAVIQQYAATATVEGVGHGVEPPFSLNQADALGRTLLDAALAAAQLQSDIGSVIRASGESPDEFEFHSRIVPAPEVTEIVVTALRPIELSLTAEDIMNDLAPSGDHVAIPGSD